MALIKSISGIRGTIGGQRGDNLTPFDITELTVAYAQLLKNKFPHNRLRVVIGRDARISGSSLSNMVTGILNLCGIDVTDIGLATTPTVEVAVPAEQAQGGIILTASHNPMEWNALKLLNENGEFISPEEGQQLLALATHPSMMFPDINTLGTTTQKDYLTFHIEKILAHPLVKKNQIRKANLKIVIDPVNSVGSIAVPALLKALGIKNIICINHTPDGRFAHNPEPLPEHLTQLSETVKKEKAHLGISVDPDVDRLAFVCEDGSMFGEEYTLVAIGDYFLSHKKGPVVSNLSSTQALCDVARKHGCPYYAAPVGEVNVVSKMKATSAIIGGEGNGGIIVPDLHYGRDALAGTAFFLSYLTSQSSLSLTALRQQYPSYIMIKSKIQLNPSLNPDTLLQSIKTHYASLAEINEEDGLKLTFHEKKQWVHIRKSNTEPILRIYAEGPEQAGTENLIKEISSFITPVALP